MGREVRRVPADWEHPKTCGNKYEPLDGGYDKCLTEFKAMIENRSLEYALDYYGGGPVRDDYMPEWPEWDKTHYMMYETCTEGTPISPALASPEELAQWLADNDASAFGDQTATYDQWLHMITGCGHSVSAIIINGVLRSGVEGQSQIDKNSGKPA